MFTTLISPSELAAALEECRIIDCRHDLMRPELGEQQYREAHIPGARFAHLDRDLSAPKTGSNGRHALPSPEAFMKWLGENGITASDQVVAYDGGAGAMASRLWWMLRWVGHEAVAVLDGGIALWQAEGRALTAELPPVSRARYVGTVRSGMAADVDQVRAHLGAPDMMLLDARAPARFRGESEPIDPVAGRIPGAFNRVNALNAGPDGRMKDSATLRTEFDALLAGRPPAQLVHYCGSGVAACHNLLAMEVAGLGGSRLYAGSWSEWQADPVRPRESG